MCCDAWCVCDGVRWDGEHAMFSRSAKRPNLQPKKKLRAVALK
jgi:hypothetical protein